MDRAIRHYAEIMDDRARMLEGLASVLAEVGAEHALIGGLAVGHHGRERATIDVDVLVPKKKLEPIATALERQGYKIQRLADMLRVYDRDADLDQDEAIADLVSKDANPVLDAAFRSTEDATVLGHAIKVVKRGALVALKFHAATSPSRKHADRLQDVVDIERIITRKFDPEDEELAHRILLGAHAGAADDLDRLLDDLRSGRPVTI
jgi:hypothetical protein